MNIEKGKIGEDVACGYLQEKGLKLLKRNYRTPYGEIDLIMRDGNVLVFVEVKYRTSDHWGDPLESVNRRKQYKIQSVADHYLYCYGTNSLCRFDVVGILKDEINWVKGVFS